MSEPTGSETSVIKKMSYTAPAIISVPTAEGSARERAAPGRLAAKRWRLRRIAGWLRARTARATTGSSRT